MQMAAKIHKRLIFLEPLSLIFLSTQARLLTKRTIMCKTLVSQGIIISNFRKRYRIGSTYEISDQKINTGFRNLSFTNCLRKQQ
jgi:hypothetical protein